MTLCECGCQKEVKPKCRFIHGHNGKFIKHNNSGENNPFFNKHHTERSKQKNRNAHIGNEPWNKGKINVYSEETLKAISESGKGRIPPNKGISPSEETKEKNREWHLGKEPWNKGLLGYHSGKNHWNWQDGISFEPYCKKFNEKNKEKIRIRDNRVCQECGKTELKNGKKLICHHIHYDKLNCDPDLISLCIGCNTKANYNRDYWEEYFMKKLKERNLLKRRD